MFFLKNIKNKFLQKRQHLSFKLMRIQLNLFGSNLNQRMKLKVEKREAINFLKLFKIQHKNLIFFINKWWCWIKLYLEIVIAIIMQTVNKIYYNKIKFWLSLHIKSSQERNSNKMYFYPKFNNYKIILFNEMNNKMRNFLQN